MWGSTDSMDGRCIGIGAIAGLTPEMVGSMYGRISCVSFLVVHPSGLIIVANVGIGSEECGWC